MPATRKTRNVITCDLPESMVQWIDTKAEALNLSRSAYLRLLVHRAMASAADLI
jgi:hypothetical protein